jgi:hypothetical protein
VTLPVTFCSAPADLDTGTYPVIATYSGDENHAGATDTTRFTVVKAATAVGAEVSDETASQGTRVVLTATGLPEGAAGTVTFAADGEVLCTVTLPRTSCATSAALPPGSYRVTADYSGDANHRGSTATTEFAITAVEKETVTVSTSDGKSTVTPIPGADTARSVEISRKPAHGTATIVDGRVVYTPADGFVGTDTVVVRIVDADGTVRLMTVKIRVAGSPSLVRLPVTGVAVIVPVLAGTSLLVVGSAAAWTARRQRA